MKQEKQECVYTLETVGYGPLTLTAPSERSNDESTIWQKAGETIFELLTKGKLEPEDMIVVSDDAGNLAEIYLFLPRTPRSDFSRSGMNRPFSFLNRRVESARAKNAILI